MQTRHLSLAILAALTSAPLYAATPEDVGERTDATAATAASASAQAVA